MDETCCFLDRSVHKTLDIGSKGHKQQIAIRNETRATATMIPIISASGKVFPPTVIFQDINSDLFLPASDWNQL